MVCRIITHFIGQIQVSTVINFDIPIFGVDIVSAPKGILAAIVDLSPVAKELPFNIRKELSKYGSGLKEKKEILVLTKSDLINEIKKFV